MRAKSPAELRLHDPFRKGEVPHQGSTSLPTTVKFGSRFAFGTADQVLTSLPNFVLAIALARWFGAEEYGIWAIIQASLLVIAGFHTSIFQTPIAIVGPAQFKSRPFAYLATLVKLHIGVSAIYTAALLVLCITLYSVGADRLFGYALIGLTFPAILTGWMLRRAFYLLEDPIGAARMAAVNAALVLGATFTLKYLNVLSPTVVFWIQGAAALIACSPLLYAIFSRLPVIQVQPRLTQVAGEHWNVGKWLIAATVAYSASELVYLPLATIFLGVSAAGIFRSMQALIYPALQITAVLGLLLQPRYTRLYGEGGMRSVHAAGWSMMRVVVLISTSCALMVGTFSEELVALVYNHSEFVEHAWILATLTPYLVLAAAEQVLNLMHSSSTNTKPLFVSRAAAAIWTGAIGVPLLMSMGLQGLVIAYVGSTAVAVVISYLKVRGPTLVAETA